ncbi:MAG TPA: GDP-mannose 4,6-dehydratase [Terriglobales bacterium]|nr:GDP-mannose 4,6-dehydratase [Terriglobales bacterium]
MRALITGGAGFIGSHLAERLLEQGHRVLAIDDLSTGSIDNLDGLKDHPAFSYRIDTIFNRPLLAELVDSADVIFHLAAAVGVRRIVEFPVRTIETNVRGSELVLELASKKSKRVVITSTSEVYGKATKVPFSETDDLVLGSTYNSRWSYAASKAVDEFLALAYYRERKLPVTILRLFNTAGPRQTGHYGMVLPTFVRQALAEQPLTVFGTGEQSRCFSHVHDIVTGMLACVAQDRTAGEIFNLGDIEEITIKALAERVIALTGSRSSTKYVPYAEAYAEGFEDMERRVPDIRKAGEWFGYKPTRSLDDIIRDVIKDKRQQNGQSDGRATVPAPPFLNASSGKK